MNIRRVLAGAAIVAVGSFAISLTSRHMAGWRRRASRGLGRWFVASAATLASASAGAVVIEPGDLLVIDGGANRDRGAILLYEPDIDGFTVISEGGLLHSRPHWITMDPLGGILVPSINTFGDSVVRIDPTTGEQALIAFGGFLDDPQGVTTDQFGNIFVANLKGPQGPGVEPDKGSIAKVDLFTGDQTLVSSGGDFSNPRDIALFGGDLFVVDDNAFIQSGSRIGGAVFRVDIDTGEQTVISSLGLFQNPTGIALDEDGNIFVSLLDGPGAFGAFGGVIQVDPITGAQAVLSDEGFFVNPHDVLLFGPDQLLVSDRGVGDNDDLGGLISVDLITGSQSSVVPPTVLTEPLGMFLIGSSVPEFVNIEGLTPPPPPPPPPPPAISEPASISALAFGLASLAFVVCVFYPSRQRTQNAVHPLGLAGKRRPSRCSA